MPEENKLLTVKEIAKRLGVKKSTIYHWSHIGYIPTVKLGNLIRFRWSSILKWLDKREKAGNNKRNIDIDQFFE